MTTVEMCVHMDCAGCEKNIRQALHKVKGVDDVDIDMVTQRVTVTGWADQKKVLRAVRKTGRTAVLWPYPYNVEYDGGYSQQYYNQYRPSHSYNGYSQQCYNQYHPSHSQQHGGYGAYPYSYASMSSYNYRKHGYGDSYMHEYYQRPAYSTAEERAGAMFSDDNPNACSIM